MKHIVGLSGGKDSTAMALWLAENEPRDYEYICTPTGEEPPEWELHMQLLEAKLGKPIQRITDTTLAALIEKWGALPNWRQRWCTRVLKIEPFYNYVFSHLPATCYVGLRADEMQREGFDAGGDVDGFRQRFVMQEIGWKIDDVYSYLAEHQIKIDFRTDCECCFFQRLYEWHDLYLNRRAQFERYAEWERKIGHTFRSSSRDTWPASLDGLADEFQERPDTSARRQHAGEKLRMVCRIMTEIQLRKEAGALRPDSDDAFRVLSKVKNGQVIVADIKNPSRRSTAQHNFWFAIVNTLYESQEYFKSFDDYRKCLLVKMGYCDVFKFSDGTLVPIAHSLKFGSMTDDEFQRLVEGTLDFAESVGFDRDILLSQTRERVGWAA